MEKQGDFWKRVEAADRRVAPGVIEARERWQGKQIWFLMPWGQWRRGIVDHIENDGFVAVVVYQWGSTGIGIGCYIERIPDFLRLVEM